MTKLYLDIEDIETRPNDMELGSYVRKQYWNKKETVMSKEKDQVAQIMDEWYNAMQKNNISVQPKASTILGTILAKHLNSTEDVFDRYMNTKAGEFESFWQSLSNDEKAYVEKRRQEMRDNYYAKRNLEDDQKQLLKG
tara:strand:+ start:1244 stop:1657 length:414 start_codon:yes stop_codon:yes gene_type:complete